MNVPFTAYLSATGEIRYSGEASDPLFLATNDTKILLGRALQNGWISDNEYHPLPPHPSEHHVFDYTTKQWVDPRTPETEWPLVRAQRNQLLQASDWTQLPDVPLATKDAWAAYRQALRDVTGQPDPFNIVWPVPPA